MTIHTKTFNLDDVEFEITTRIEKNLDGTKQAKVVIIVGTDNTKLTIDTIKTKVKINYDLPKFPPISTKPG